MPFWHLDATARAAWAAATTQQAQLEGLRDEWSGQMSVRYYSSADAHLATVTHATPIVDPTTTPRSLRLGAWVAESHVQDGTAAYCILAVPAGADILRADVTLAGAISDPGGRVRVDIGTTLRVQATASLPAEGVPSWASALTSFEWAEISGTNLSTAGVRQAQFGTNQGCVDGWGGLAIDPTTGIAYLTGGGHSDGADNSIYKVDLSADAPAWAREADGSAEVDWLQYITLGGNIYKARWNADGLPVAAHVYNAWQVLDGRIYRQGFYQDYGGTSGTTHSWAPNHESFLHAYSISTGLWLDPDALGVVPGYQNNSSGWNDNGWSPYYNSTVTDGTYLYVLANNRAYGDGALRVMRYTPSTDAWAAVGSEITADPSGGIKFGGVCYDESRGEMVRVGEGSSDVYRYDLTTGVRTVTSMTGAQSGFTASWNSSYFALARDPVNDCYWAYSGTTATDKVLRKIDPASSYACTTQSTTGTPTTVPSSGLNCRLRYVAFDSIGVLVMLPTYNSNLWACKVH